jgi:hypothetical protein
MILLPGWLIVALTFPGVIVHEAAHLLFCRLFGIAVLDVCFFRLTKTRGEPSGYVVHEPFPSFTSAFFIGLGPFFVNSLLCVAFASACALTVRLGVEDPLAYLLGWLGISIGMHAFPSTQDLRGVLALAPAALRRLHPLALVAYPLCGLLSVAGALRVVWADAWYAVGIGIFLPYEVVKVFA